MRLNERAWQLLEALGDGQFHAGDALARALGISRPSVCKLVSGLEAQGIVLHRIRGRGYRLPHAWQPLHAATLLEALGPVRDVLAVEIRREVDSTNAELLRQVVQQAHTGSVLVAEWQTAGRGRLGRRWMSGLGDALTFSLLWRFDAGLNALAGLSLTVGVAIVRALKTLGVRDAGLKWPNDVITPQGKLAGILIEAQGDMLGPSTVVVGVGLNLRLPSLAALAQIGQPVSGLAQLHAALPRREIVLAVLLRELVGVLQQFSREGFSQLGAEWQDCHVFQDRVVRVNLPDGRSLSGIARGVTLGGELCLETVEGLRYLNSGEVGEQA